MAETLPSHDGKSSPVAFPYQKIEDTPGFLIWQIEMCWQRRINQELVRQGLTYTQFIVLSITAWLKQTHSEIFQHQVAAYARIDRMMTSRVLANLERKHLVRRTKPAGDARTNQVMITPEGENVLLQSLRLVSLVEEEFFHTTDDLTTPVVHYLKSLLPKC